MHLLQPDRDTSHGRRVKPIITTIGTLARSQVNPVKVKLQSNGLKNFITYLLKMDADTRTADEHYALVAGKVCQDRPQHTEHEDRPAVLPSVQEALQDLVYHVYQPSSSTDNLADPINKDCVVALVALSEFTDTVQPGNKKDLNVESIEEEMAHRLQSVKKRKLVAGLLDDIEVPEQPGLGPPADIRTDIHQP